MTRVIAASAAIVLAGCGTDKGPQLDSGRPSAMPAVSPIPQVKNPRDVAAMARRTCELLTPQQAKGFGLDVPPVPSDGLFGTVSCVWTATARDRRTVRRLSLGVFTNNPTLEVVYAKDRGLPFFELTDIAGYPAIVTRTNADIPSCDIDVKAADRQSFSLTFDSKDFDNTPQQSCEVAKQVAAAVVKNLPLKR